MTSRALVGYTGFVGSNICAAARFDGLYNTKNINDSFGTKPDLLVYSGVRAEKYLANKDPEADRKQIEIAFQNIQKIDPRRLVLISTIDVIAHPVGIDEDTPIQTEGLLPYGANRYYLEQCVREQYPDALIVRLPALFGKNIKKNFIYDYIHRIPFMLTQAKMDELDQIDPNIKPNYTLQGNGFYQLNTLNEDEKATLKERFINVGFDALQFTDSRSVFQFYPLRRLWDDIQIALSNDIRILHTATEPISASEIFRALCQREFVNPCSKSPFFYDYHSKHARLFGGKDNYMMDKKAILDEIVQFVATSV